MVLCVDNAVLCAYAVIMWIALCGLPSGDKGIKFIEIKITNHEVLLEKVNHSFLVLFFRFDNHDTNASSHIHLYRQKCKVFQPTQLPFSSLYGNYVIECFIT